MMQEPAHRPMSFRANSFSRFAKKYGIRMEAQPYDPYGLVDMDTLKESKHFIISLGIGDNVHTFSVVFDKYRTELPPVDDILEYFANDAVIVRRFTHAPERFAKLIKSDLLYAKSLIRDAMIEVGPFKSLIGPEAYEEFLSITEDRG